MRVLLVILALGACAHPAPPPLLSRSMGKTSVRPRPPHYIGEHLSSARAQVVARARELLNGSPLVSHDTTFDPDPVGFVRAAYWQVHLDLFDVEVAADKQAHGMEILFRTAAVHRRLHKETPRPGDLVFFDADTRGSALFPHQVAIVESVDQDGTLRAIGLFGKGPARVVLNVRLPRLTHDASGRTLNERVAAAGNPTTGELFRVFANPFSS